MKIKQLFHFVLACGLMLSTASCTDEVVTNNGDGTDSADVPEGMQALTLKVGGISGGNVTKAGGIAKPEEIEVNDMTIYIFKYDPAKGADDTDDANYTLYDYWTYMKTPITGYTVNNRLLHTFNLGGYGQFRIATVYVPKDAGKVKCLVTTGIEGIIKPDKKIAIASVSGNQATFLSGHIADVSDQNNPVINSYIYTSYSDIVKSTTLDEVKKMTWRELKSLNLPKTADDGAASEIPTDYWKTPLSMMGETAMMNLSAQSGNSSQIETTLKRHVSRLDIINNNLDIRTIELVNLPFSTNVVPAVDGIEAATQITLGASKTVKTGDDPVDMYTFETVYTKNADILDAITCYVYPNLPYNTTETEKNTPFIRVKIGDIPETYILPLRTKSEDGSYTPVNLKSNHRYTLQLNKLGDNVLDYNIVIEDWQAGADFNVNLGQEVTAAMFNYTPAFSSIMDYNATVNQVIMEGKGKAYYYPNTSGGGTELKWGFLTDNTLYPTYESHTTNKLNILTSSSPGQLGEQIFPDYVTGAMAGGTETGHSLDFSTNYSHIPQYATCWYTLQNPFNTSKSLRLKAEQIVHPSAENTAKWAFEETLFATTETNAVAEGTGTYTVADFQADSYYTQWPDKGAAMTTDNVYGNIPDITLLLPSYDVTGTPLNTTTGIDLAAEGFKTFKAADGTTCTIASNGNAETPCLILQADLMRRMWERIKGDDGTYYIRILSVPYQRNTFSSFETMRSEIRNIENGHTNYEYIVRYFPEGNYWKYNAGGNKRFSFASGTFGKEITEGATGYIRPAHAVPTP